MASSSGATVADAAETGLPLGHFAYDFWCFQIGNVMKLEGVQCV